MKTLRSFFIVLLMIPQLVWAQQNFTWGAYPGNASQKTFILDNGWTGSVTATAYAAAGGRILSTLVQPTTVKTGTTLVVSFSAFATRTLSGTTYIEIAMGGIVRFKGYLTISYSTTTASSGTVVAGGGGGGSVSVPTSNTAFSNEARYQNDQEVQQKIMAALSSFSVSAGASSQFAYLLVAPGESTIMGSALPGAATPTELSVRPGVQIMNGATTTFASLQVGVNNYQGLRLADNTRHGVELQLANRVAAGSFKDSPVYLIKTGQAGSTFAEWTKGGPFWNLTVARVDSAKKQIRAQGKIPLVVFWASLGINNWNLSPDAAANKAGIVQFKNDIRSQFGFVPIVWMEFARLLTYEQANVGVREIAASDPFFFIASSLGASTPASNDVHFDYAGNKVIANRMVDITINQIGEREQYLANALTAIAGTVGSGGSSTGGGSTTVSAGCGTTAVTGWTNTVSAANSTGLKTGTYLLATSSAGPSGGLGTTSFSGNSCWSVTADYDDSPSAQLAIVYVDNTTSDDYVVSGKNYAVGGLGILGATLYYLEDTNLTTTGVTVTFPCRVKIAKSGTSLVYSVINSSGTETVVRTSTGRLASQTGTLYSKVIFNPTSANTLKTRVVIDKP